MRVVVIGAGLAGVSAAWYLAANGHEVEVIERQPAVAEETSFANGGQISVCHAEPWANPAAPLNVLRWLGHEASPLLWRLRADPAQWAWGLRFLRECLPGRTQANMGGLIRLGLYSRGLLQALRAELNLQYEQRTRGILHFYTDSAEFEHACRQAELMTRLGCTRLPQTAAECIALEPALAHSAIPLRGGTFTPEDESGDARQFCRQLAADLLARGGRIRYGAPIERLACRSERVEGVVLADGQWLKADAYVMAAGSYSAPLLRPLGLRLPIYPAKGYSLTYPLVPGSLAPEVSLTDDGHKLVFSRLGDRLRVAGTAEFNGFNLELNNTRLRAIARRVEAIFPRLQLQAEAEAWTGLRPATPGNLPLIGPTRWPNLFLNTGHGTLGWTLACGSAALLRDLIEGKAPALDPQPYLPRH